MGYYWSVRYGGSAATTIISVKHNRAPKTQHLTVIHPNGYAAHQTSLSHLRSICKERTARRQKNRLDDKKPQQLKKNLKGRAGYFYKWNYILAVAVFVAHCVSIYSSSLKGVRTCVKYFKLDFFYRVNYSYSFSMVETENGKKLHPPLSHRLLMSMSIRVVLVTQHFSKHGCQGFKFK